MKPTWSCTPQEKQATDEVYRSNSNLINISLKGNKNCNYSVSTCKSLSILYQNMFVKLSVCIVELLNKIVAFLSVKWVMLPSIKKDTNFHNAGIMSYLLNSKFSWLWIQVISMIKFNKHISH